jgi:hypothetical protein
MTWPIDITSKGGKDGLVLIPNKSAIIQDLGPYLSGRAMLTDIMQGSALICHAIDGLPMVNQQGLISFAFEGNMNGAVNLERFHEKCSCAAGRLAHRHPSIAYGQARSEDLTPVARYDLERYVFTEIMDAPALEAWCGERIESFLPPEIATPCTDMEIIKPLLALPMSPVHMDYPTAALWKLQNGRIVAKLGEGDLCIYRPEDEELIAIMDRLNMDDHSKVLAIGSGPPASASDQEP